MDGNIFNSRGDHVGMVMGGEVFGLKGQKLYDLKGSKIYKLNGDLGQRFLGSNHIRRPRRVCKTKYG
jgi:hypothetical protein